MGTIKGDVEDGHLLEFPQERQLLSPFLAGFDVTWAKRRRAYNTELSIYFLNPEKHMREQFGFDQEILLALSDFSNLQARSMQAIESIIAKEPAKGRVDQGIFFVASLDLAGPEWISEYRSQNPQSRIPVSFSWNDLKFNSDPWFIRNALSSQLFSRDLFDYTLPIDSDLFFFGRDAIVAEYLDAARRSQNRGLFGLRKTGKTSVLFKIRRIADRNDVITLYYDCKIPSIRSQRWAELLDRISNDIFTAVGKTPGAKTRDMHVSDRFLSAMKAVPSKRRICLIFDEVEYISPIAILDRHWREDFIPFWQTLWTAQSVVRTLSFTVAGVNPSIVEMDSIDGIQNPVFGIVKSRYLTGFELPELRSMLNYFGKRMGLRFTSDSIEYLFDRYGGHPLLTRMACSHFNNEMPASTIRRPVDVTADKLRSTEDAREQEIQFYSRHIVTELKQFYPVEYEMLEMAAIGNEADFREYTAEPEYTKHLRGYGLLEIAKIGQPRFKIPVVKRYVAMEWAQRTGAAIPRYIVAPERRPDWLRGRTQAIIKELRTFEKIRTAVNAPLLYGEHSFPESDRFAAITVVTEDNSFDIFVNICNRCLVEPIENHANKVGRKQYFWVDIKNAYPDLFHALCRIKAYRNNSMHIFLNQNADQMLNDYLAEDLDSRTSNLMPDTYFRLQQSIIDGLFIAIQNEMVRYG